MNTKDLLTKLFANGYGSGIISESNTDLLVDAVSKMSLKELLFFKNNLIDDNFKALMKDADMVNCIEEFFKYDLNIAATSRNSFLHRNTLLYRLDKINHLTGYNLKSFDDAVNFKILMHVYRLTT